MARLRLKYSISWFSGYASSASVSAGRTRGSPRSKRAGEEHSEKCKPRDPAHRAVFHQNRLSGVEGQIHGDTSDSRCPRNAETWCPRNPETSDHRLHRQALTPFSGPRYGNVAGSMGDKCRASNSLGVR